MTPILHHDASSTFWEMVRTAFGLKGLPWQSAEIPGLTPRPLLSPLTGGHRRPVTATRDDNARVPVGGTLVAAGRHEVVIHRRDARAGDLHIHFPRLGFDVVAA